MKKHWLFCPELLLTAPERGSDTGGGFYDAYLDGNDRCIRAALAFDAQLVEKVPAEEHDVRAEYIITEKELIRCSQDYPETP